MPKTPVTLFRNTHQGDPRRNAGRLRLAAHVEGTAGQGHPRKHAGLILHSDRGSQYASEDFRDVLAQCGITASLSRKGNCWDNACSETLFGSLKAERLQGQRFVTRRQARDEVIAWVLWYNRARLLSTLAYVSPVRFEQDWHAAQAKQANS